VKQVNENPNHHGDEESNNAFHKEEAIPTF